MDQVDLVDQVDTNETRPLGKPYPRPLRPLSPLGPLGPLGPHVRQKLARNFAWVWGMIAIIALTGFGQAADAPTDAASDAASAPASATPVTRPILDLVPDSAVIALALPPVRGLYEKSAGWARAITGPNLNAVGALDEAVRALAVMAGAPSATTIPDIASALGLNPDAPIGVFVDLGPTGANARRAIASKMTSPSDLPDDDPPIPPLAERWSRMGVPATVLVVTCVDPPRAEALLKTCMTLMGISTDSKNTEEMRPDQDVLRWYGNEFGYCLAGSQLFAANYLPLLRETLARRSRTQRPTPATPRYGTPDCPAEAADEAVALVRIDRIMTLVPDLTPIIGAVAAEEPETLLRRQARALRSLSSVYGGADPMICTLTWTDKQFTLRARTDLARHSDLAAVMSETKPLRFARYLPTGTRFLAAFRFNNADRVQAEEFIRCLPPALQERLVVEFLKQAIPVVGDEIVLGVMLGPGSIRPYLIASLAARDKAESLLASMAPLTPEKDPQAPWPIFRWEISPSVPIYVAFSEDTCVMEMTDRGNLNQLGALFHPQEETAALQAIVPQLDPSTPIHSLVAVDTDLLDAVSGMPDAEDWNIPSAVTTWVRTLASTFRQVHAIKSVRNHWLDSSLAFYMR